MNYDINYIIYNNRSKDLVKQFLPKVNLNRFLELENKYSFIQKLFKSPYSFEIPEQHLNLDFKDVIYSKSDINSLKDKILQSNQQIHNSKEYEYLLKRNIPIDIINKYKIATLSFGWSESELNILSATLHPLMKDIILNDINCGIILPLFDPKGEIINFAIRRMMNGPIKYSLSVPDVHIWGLDDVSTNDEIWICEGIFDYYALKQQKLKALTVSSASWSTIQLYQLIERKPKIINIFSDYDYTGLRSSLILKRLLNLYNIETKIWISGECKDACEHFFEKNLDFSKIEETAVTKELLEELEPDENEKLKNYIEYLRLRKI